MKNKYITASVTALLCVTAMFFGKKFLLKDYSCKTIKVGFVYIGDAGNAYTNNFIRAQIELEEALKEKIQTVTKYNILESDCDNAIYDLIEQKCDLIFTTSYGYSQSAKRIAAEHPEVQFCQATGDQANVAPILPNFHNFMGTIYQGRYTAGVVAGMKLLDLISKGQIARNRAKIGYVAAFPYAEVISGYTAFFMGARSVIPEATMVVRYTDTWSNYVIEKKCAEKLIYQDGCVIVSQHSDTTGPAIACEEASSKRGKTVFHVGYNQSMIDVAPKTSLVSCRVNWAPYIIDACKAVLQNKTIESVAKTQIKGCDATAGFEKNWIEMIGLNTLIAAPGSSEEMEKIIKQFKSNSIEVFKGNYIGENPFDKNDIWDLRTPFPENKSRSAPSFCYVLRDVIEIK